MSQCPAWRRQTGNRVQPGRPCSARHPSARRPAELILLCVPRLLYLNPSSQSRSVHPWLATLASSAFLPDAFSCLLVFLVAVLRPFCSIEERTVSHKKSATANLAGGGHSVVFLPSAVCVLTLDQLSNTNSRHGVSGRSREKNGADPQPSSIPADPHHLHLRPLPSRSHAQKVAASLLSRPLWHARRGLFQLVAPEKSR